VVGRNWFGTLLRRPDGLARQLKSWWDTPISSAFIAQLRFVYHETGGGALQYLLYVFAGNVANRSHCALPIPLIRLRSRTLHSSGARLFTVPDVGAPVVLQKGGGNSRTKTFSNESLRFSAAG